MFNTYIAYNIYVYIKKNATLHGCNLQENMMMMDDRSDADIDMLWMLVAIPI